jgi:PAS domain S-box-containing protein
MVQSGWSSLKISQKHLWIVIALLAFATFFQYSVQLGIPFTSPPTNHFGLSRTTFDRILLLIPIIYAGWVFGLSGGILLAVLTVIVSLPQVIIFSSSRLDSALEVVGMAATGVLISFLFWSQTKERKKADKALVELEEVQRTLQGNVDALTKSEKRLQTLNDISTTLFSSLSLEGTFLSANHLVRQLMSADVSLLLTLDEAKNELNLVACEGVSDECAIAARTVNVTDGIFGKVVAGGEPLIAEAPIEVEKTADTLVKSKVEVQLIVPLKLKNRVSGIICIAMRQPRQFSREDVELLSTVATQIAVAVENAKLYHEQSQTSALLAASEGKYRRLFELASDAIWANDLRGKIIIANRASAELMGDRIEEMIGEDVRMFLPPEGLVTARAIRQDLLAGKTIPQPYEQRLVRKDKAEVILMVSTSLVRSGDEPVIFEHVARDVTKERRMQDNLRHYVQQITRTQEEERNRIARDLHDDTAQALYALTRSLDNYTRSTANLPAETTVFLKGLDEQLRAVLQSVRRFSQELRPPMLDDLGLMSALRWLVNDMQKRCGIDASIEITGPQVRLPQHAELVVFRIVQESLRNVEKHAAASVVRVSVHFNPDKMRISVSDNGKGFKLKGELGELPREGRLGLVGLEERARLVGGSLKIESEIDQGTKILVELPVRQ